MYTRIYTYIRIFYYDTHYRSFRGGSDNGAGLTFIMSDDPPAAVWVADEFLNDLCPRVFY